MYIEQYIGHFIISSLITIYYWDKLLRSYQTLLLWVLGKQVLTSAHYTIIDTISQWDMSKYTLTNEIVWIVLNHCNAILEKINFTK